ncbi:hypothetical protein Y032_0144g2445 [Ancylostoma ceylanicum]|uniref:Uncharacterized protein n=1 Tax=Ancylostoma ceylanicum TaxID=53326 RepID=A0A016T1V6_9BILA|nr:hypothetical protein Y032_0144g2445 [Ancylostoma ceylanicum]
MFTGSCSTDKLIPCKTTAFALDQAVGFTYARLTFSSSNALSWITTVDSQIWSVCLLDIVLTLGGLASLGGH